MNEISSLLLIAIDGACRRNGSVDCLSAGGVAILRYDEANEVYMSKVLANNECCSTNQRGELLALLIAIDYAWESKMSANIVTDSEYIFNSITKEWHKNWQRTGWRTAAGGSVKNKDIWMEVLNAQQHCEEAGLELSFYFIKGHCIPFSQKVAKMSLQQDISGLDLIRQVDAKYDACKSSKVDVLKAANDLSKKNNGFELEPSIMKLFVVANTVADAVATQCVEAADSYYKS